jgi:hypothetical protein
MELGGNSGKEISKPPVSCGALTCREKTREPDTLVEPEGISPLPVSRLTDGSGIGDEVAETQLAELLVGNQIHWPGDVAPPNDPKLSDGGGWRDGCAGEGGGAASVTAGAVRCSAWLGPRFIRA